MKFNTTVLFGVLLLTSINSQAEDKVIGVNASAAYYDENLIPTKITEECKDLGTQFSAATKSNLEKDGWTVTDRNNEEVPKAGTQLKLTISNVLSSGNAFLGHHKSVSVIAGLYKNGTLIDTFKGTRDSGGGFGGGFKSSCDVLERCVNALGKDTTKWVKEKAM